MKQKNNLRVLSLGAGVQSTTLALMIEHKLIKPIDFAVFADTKHETDDTYKHLEFLIKKCSFPIKIVCAGDLLEDTFKKNIDIPFHIMDQGKGAIIRRQCTNTYKIKPVYQEIRKALKLKKGERIKKGISVDLLMGISLDEIVRTKTNPIKWFKNTYPLIDVKMRRSDCKKWLQDNDYIIPPRSACWFCPYNSKDRWIDLKKNYPNYFTKAIELDERIRNYKGSYNTINDTAKLFLHSRKKPLKDIDFENKNPDQMEFSELDECEGVCFI